MRSIVRYIQYAQRSFVRDFPATFMNRLALRSPSSVRAGRAIVRLAVVFVLALPLGVSAQSISGTTLPESARTALAEIMQEAGVTSVVVTRTKSSSSDQVRVMHNFIRRYGVESAKRMYGAEGDAVVAVYEASPANADSQKVAMLAELIRQLPAAQANGRLMHLSSDYTVFDLSLSRFVPQDSVETFVDLARKHTKTRRVLGRDEGEKEAIHIEFTK